MRKKYSLLILVLIAASSFTFGQISVTPNSNASQLAQIMSGPGVIISNVNINSAGLASGSFTCNNCSLGMDSGIVLTTGLAANVVGPNNSGAASYPWSYSTNGDQDLANSINQPVGSLFDNCALEFDLIAQTDSVQFKYIFGSEEYPEYVCSAFNDAFAFFISGPGIAGLQNIALIPGTTVPVAINSINSGTPGTSAGGGTCNGTNQSLTYSQYYVNNGNGSQAPYNTNPFYIQYDGFTKTLTAAAGGLIPCQTYHLKLVIDDVGDPTLDSGVFIEANSLSSNAVKFNASQTTIPGIDSAVRGCVDGLITLSFLKPVTQTTVVTYTTGGTAVSGTDYSALTGTVQFNTGDSAKQVVIHPTGNATQTQSVTLYLTNSCSPIPYDSSTIYIIAPPQITTNADTSICPGDSVQLHTNIYPGVTYSWSPNTNITATNISNPVVFPASSTIYTCTASFLGCSSTASVTVNVYTAATVPFTVNAGPDVLACGGAAVQLNASVSGNPVGGNAFAYNWTPATGLNNTNIANPVDGAAAATTYVVHVASGRCTATDTIKVTIDSVMATLSSTPTSCWYGANGTATANVTAGQTPYTYIWTGGANTVTASNLSAGLAQVTITDAAGCKGIDTITVYAPPAIVFGAPTITNVSCPGGNNGSATITATGGTGTITYAWSSGSNTSTASNLSATTYTVTATDANTCTATASVLIGTVQPLAITISTTNVSCFGGADGTATATVTGGTSPDGYLWSNTQTTATATGLILGTYQVTVTDNAGCTASTTANMAQNPLLAATEVSSNVSCFGGSNGSIIISPSGGTTPYTYHWNDNNTQQNRTGIPAGTYTLTITDARSCTTLDTATLTQPTALWLSDSVVNATCYGIANGAIYQTDTGGTPPYAYDWGNGSFSQNLTNIAAGSYYPSVTDNQGCMVNKVVVVTSPNQIIFGPSTTTPASCFGKSDGIAQVNIGANDGTPPFIYTWNGVTASNPNTGLAAGTYAVIATDANNCTAVDTVIVAQPPVLTLAINGTDASCYSVNNGNGSAVDVVTGGTLPYTYNWSNGQTSKTASFLAANVYQSTVTDNNGCTASNSVLIGQPGQILYTVDSTAVKCIGSKDGTITINVTSGGVAPYSYAATKDFANFSFQTAATIQGLDTGLYVVEISDASGCEVGTTVYVPNAVPDSFNITTDSTSCFGPQYTDGAIHVTGLVSINTPYQYQVDAVPYQFSGDFYNLAAGTHSIQVTNYHGCITDTSAIIGAPVQGVAEVLPHDTTIQLGESIQLFSSFSNYPASAITTYNWVPSMGLSCVDCPNPVVSSYSHINNYKLTITYNNGCVASDSLRVIVVGQPQVFIPNSFSPNGDGNNDLFLIYGDNIKTVNLKVFNRWGEVVFNSENLFLGWDGNYKGQAQQTGVYVYEAQITFLDNTQTLRTGSITLLR